MLLWVVNVRELVDFLLGNEYCTLDVPSIQFSVLLLYFLLNFMVQLPWISTLNKLTNDLFYLILVICGQDVFLDIYTFIVFIVDCLNIG